MVVAKGRVGEIGAGGKRIQSSSYKMNKSGGYDVQHGDSG